MLVEEVDAVGAEAAERDPASMGADMPEMAQFRQELLEKARRFYAAFMVADRVTLLTRKAGETGGTRWESTGEGTYSIETVDEAPEPDAEDAVADGDEADAPADAVHAEEPAEGADEAVEAEDAAEADTSDVEATS